MGTRVIKKDSTTPEAMLRDVLANTAVKNECLEWTRCFNTDGYARMSNNVKVHRLVYELSSGKSAKGFVVRHVCDNIKCINPDHLVIGNIADNVKDMDVRNRRYRKITVDIIKKVKELLETKLLSHVQIAKAVDIDCRRVSDINCGRYNDDGSLNR